MKRSMVLILSAILVACETLGTGTDPVPTSHDGTFKVVDAKVWGNKIVPDWATKPDGFQFKFPAVITFNHAVDKETLQSDITFDATINGVEADGTFQFSADGRTAVFYSDKEVSDITPILAGRNIDICIKMRGSTGTITDELGQVWPFSGVHAVIEDDVTIQPVPGIRGQLLDGDFDNIAGGDYNNCWSIVG